MKKELAQNILKNLVKYSKNRNEKYSLRVLNNSEYEGGFHTFVNKGEILDIFTISNDENTSYYFVFVDFKKHDEDVYINIFPKSKSSTVLELHKVNECYDSKNIVWRYIPNKQDGRNEDRREYFKANFGDLENLIHVPNSINEVEKFLSDIFDLAKAKIESNNSIL